MTDWQTIKQFSKHPAVTEGGLRHRIFRGKENGLEDSGALLRDGRKILISPERYFQWLEKKNSEGSTKW